jgi:hypothetical protein
MISALRNERQLRHAALAFAFVVTGVGVRPVARSDDPCAGRSAC